MSRIAVSLVLMRSQAEVCASRLQQNKICDVLVALLHHGALFVHRGCVSIGLLNLQDDPLENLHSSLHQKKLVNDTESRWNQTCGLHSELKGVFIITSFSLAEDSMNAAPQESANFFPSSGLITLGAKKRLYHKIKRQNI